MAAGDLITRPYQYEFNGILYGAGTPAPASATPKAQMIVTSLDGLHSMPDLQSNDIQRADRHGAVFGNDFMGPRKIVMAVDVLVETGVAADMEATLTTLAARHHPMPAYRTLPWVFMRPDNVKKVINVRTRRRQFTAGYDMAHGDAAGTIQWDAPDPTIYALAVSNQAIVIPVGATNAQTIVNSGGAYTTWPKFTITGPATNPIITVSGQTPLDDGQDYSGRSIRVNAVIPNGQTLVIDTNLRTVTLQGVAHYEYLSPDNQWWALLPGNNTIQYSRTDNGAASTCTVTWQDAWV